MRYLQNCNKYQWCTRGRKVEDETETEAETSRRGRGQTFRGKARPRQQTRGRGKAAKYKAVTYLLLCVGTKCADRWNRGGGRGWEWQLTKGGDECWTKINMDMGAYQMSANTILKYTNLRRVAIMIFLNLTHYNFTLQVRLLNSVRRN